MDSNPTSGSYVNGEHKINSESHGGGELTQANKLFQTGVMLIYGKRKSVDKAIKCIQKAITFNDADYKYWQFLGEAYYQRGSLNPAINCFMKSLKLAEFHEGTLELEEQSRRQADCTYSRLRMSDIRLSVGHLEEAALGYSDIIASDPDHTAALIGLSKTELQSARNSFSSGQVKLGHSQCMRALKFSLRAIKLCPHLCLTWKLASDCCLIQFVSGQRGQFKASVDEEFPGFEGDSLSLDRRTCIELAQQFLCKAIDIEPFQDSGCLWHNLGISLYLKTTIVQDAREKEALLKRSLKCLLKALSSNRNNSQFKNSIGVVAFNLNLLNSAQNFFIRSIQTNLSTNEIQFSNLGYMYLQKGEFRLATVAFSRCQAEEPLYSRSWLGNALINEQSNSDNLSYLRHCHRLENNYVSQLMFATKVSSLPCTGANRKDTIDALDCMQRIINYDSLSIEANNTLGLLYERCHHSYQAESCFNRAHSICRQDPRIICNKLRLHCATDTCCTVSEGCIANIDTDFIKLAEKLANGGNREYTLNFIYYLFRNGDYKNVDTKMTSYLDKLSRDDLRSKISAQIMLGLAARAEGCDFKSWLFKNVIDVENIVCIEASINLLCLMLLGAITKDHLLVDQISNDLSRHLLTFISSSRLEFPSLFYSLDGYWLRLAIFSSIFCLRDRGRLIRSLLALFPMMAELWLYLGISLMFDKAKLQTAIFCIKKANLIGSTNADLGVVCDISLSILTQIVKLKPGTLYSRDKYLSRAIYKYPQYQLLWTTLLSATANEKHRKNNVQNEENSNLFYLAIDHILTSVIS